MTMASDRARTALGDRPDGGLSGLWHDNLLRLNVAQNHVFAEGKEVQVRAVLVGYDRAEHPIMHGRRVHDLIKRVQEVFSRE